MRYIWTLSLLLVLAVSPLAHAQDQPEEYTPPTVRNLEFKFPTKQSRNTMKKPPVTSKYPKIELKSYKTGPSKEDLERRRKESDAAFKQYQREAAAEKQRWKAEMAKRYKHYYRKPRGPGPCIEV